MIQSNELRIGNKLEILRPMHGNKYVTVESIADQDINIHFRPLYFTEVEPIALTEEMLLKFNILRDYDGLFILSDNLKLSLGIDNVKVFFNGIYHLCTIDAFVHTLQNFYFSFTQTELEINI